MTQQKIKCKTPIIILAVVAVVSTILSCLTKEYFAGSLFIDREGYLSDASLLVYEICAVAAFLFLWFVMEKNKGNKQQTEKNIMAAIWFCMTAFSYSGVMYCCRRVSKVSFEIIVYFLLMVVSLVFAILYLNGIMNRGLFIVSTAIGIMAHMGWIFEGLKIVINGFSRDGVWYFNPGDRWFYSLLSGAPYLLIGLGMITLFGAILIFAMTNIIPNIDAVKRQQRVAKASPEELLAVLKEKYELGLISEEEYAEQRVAILEKLK